MSECTYTELTDTATLVFSTPIDGTIVLSNEEFENGPTNKVQLFPNPTNGVLHIEQSSDIELLSISMFNVIGAKILDIKSVTNTIDLSAIDAGIYFLNIETNKERLIKRLIKE